MLSSKGETAPFDGSASRWTFAQKHYSNSPFIRGLQGANFSKLEVINLFLSIFLIDDGVNIII
jgi:hypothetical protein